MRYRTELALFALFALMPAGRAADGAADRCDNCGTVVTIQKTTQQEQWTPLGTISPPNSMAPSVAGGGDTRSAFVFGKDGNQGLVVVGAAGGAVYGKRPNAYEKPRWDVSLKLDNGSTRVIQQRYEPLLHEGDRVRIYGTQLELI